MKGGDRIGDAMYIWGDLNPTAEIAPLFPGGGVLIIAHFFIS